MTLPVKHYAIFQLLVSTPNPDQNLTVKIWIQTQHQHYSIPLKVSVFDKNLQVIAEPLAFENCHPVSVKLLILSNYCLNSFYCDKNINFFFDIRELFALQK